MFTTRKRAWAQTLLASSALVLGAALAGCSDDSEAASSDGGTSASAGSPFDQAVEYAQCMRDNGVPEFKDPEQDTGGVMFRQGGFDPESAEFKAAEEACRDKQPQRQGGPNGGEPLDSEKVAEWAECIRQNGLPDFPDPEIDGNSMVMDMDAVDPTTFEPARKACQDKYPGGGMRIGGGPQ
ncbi:hypothetical protein O7599_02285 [Streptomyces sp. WMMC500]|uniref:hypothetical protein n=1 Tax=Streptomyces sp. WMMC500 TaxID=3015154 RepID=UPI00248BC054|nr:hypothetical protein [Streptomyces sp. WMMC500]WBB61409.1 hypothetical protein O7599_02285 [Streptomyces sp. WMMC500]